MIAHVCATVHAECMLRKGASEKWHPPPQPQNLFVYVLLRTVLRESARLVWQTEFQLLSFSLSSEQYAAIFEEITAQAHTFTFLVPLGHTFFAPLCFTANVYNSTPNTPDRHSGCSTFTPLSRVDASKWLRIVASLSAHANAERFERQGRRPRACARADVCRCHRQGLHARTCRINCRPCIDVAVGCRRGIIGPPRWHVPHLVAAARCCEQGAYRMRTDAAVRGR